mmetsp:Transcript_7844/g.14222  ORF Transcript_7844/g.14222 Transcript_7844/m.14222 type:complete len:112 (+) Transcript_7844:482-817(+)
MFARSEAIDINFVDTASGDGNLVKLSMGSSFWPPSAERKMKAQKVARKSETMQAAIITEKAVEKALAKTSMDESSMGLIRSALATTNMTTQNDITQSTTFRSGTFQGHARV